MVTVTRWIPPDFVALYQVGEFTGHLETKLTEQSSARPATFELLDHFGE